MDWEIHLKYQSYNVVTIQNIDRLKDKNMKDLNKNDVSQLLESIKSFFSDDPDKK